MSWEPLHSGDPFPADPAAMDSYGAEVSRTGELIADQIRLLRLVAQGDRWTTDTADAFRERATETADKIAETKDRYVRVGAAVTTLAGQCEEHERQAKLLVADAVAAEAQIAANPEQTPTAGEDGAPPELTDAQRSQNSRRHAAVGELADLQRRFDALVAAAEEDGRACQSEIDDAKDDGVKDNFWECNAGWLKALASVLGALAAFAGIVLLTVATAGTFWLVVAVAAGILALSINLVLALKADGSWVDVAFDALGLVTLGAGSLIGRGAQAAFKGVQTAVAGARSTRAFDAVMDGARFYGFAGRVANFSVSLFGRTARLPDVITDIARSYRAAVDGRAFGAAQEAWQAVMTAPRTSVAARVFWGGPDEAALVPRIASSIDDLRGLPQMAGVVSSLERSQTLLRVGVGVNGVGLVNDAIDLSLDGVEYGSRLLDRVR